MNFVATEAELERAKKYMWNESKCGLHWIRDKGKIQPRFVKNRLDEIRKFSALFKYVPNCDNSADIATRGITPEELFSNLRWWKGSPWLGDETMWPNWDPDECYSGTVTSEDIVSEGVVSMKIECDPSLLWIDSERYSNLYRMVGFAGYFLRFIKKVTKEKFSWLDHTSITGPLTAADCQITVRCILLQEQRSGINDEEKMGVV
ncbi:unnamed protein product [Gongylonema pulchrum]|uniref:Retrotransposon protein n=1 Tax=Gongylonema pulchrum TaxID=637853 RepID=A0A183E5W9_9BILA|nr:unnamed protein product [Gongylonema pulchrum]